MKIMSQLATLTDKFNEELAKVIIERNSKTAPEGENFLQYGELYKTLKKILETYSGSEQHIPGLNYNSAITAPLINPGIIFYLIYILIPIIITNEIKLELQFLSIPDPKSGFVFSLIGKSEKGPITFEILLRDGIRINFKKEYGEQGEPALPDSYDIDLVSDSNSKTSMDVATCRFSKFYRGKNGNYIKQYCTYSVEYNENGLVKRYTIKEIDTREVDIESSISINWEPIYSQLTEYSIDGSGIMISTRKNELEDLVSSLRPEGSQSNVKDYVRIPSEIQIMLPTIPGEIDWQGNPLNWNNPNHLGNHYCREDFYPVQAIDPNAQHTIDFIYLLFPGLAKAAQNTIRPPHARVYTPPITEL